VPADILVETRSPPRAAEVRPAAVAPLRRSGGTRAGDNAVKVRVRRLADSQHPEASTGRAWAVLSAAERDRALAMARADDTARFILARATLREALGERTGVPAAAVRLELVDGRPVVVDRPSLAVSI
jgi:hypothetical protein